MSADRVWQCVTLLLASVLARPLWAGGPPLLVRSELKATDPLDRVQKQSHVRMHNIDLQEGQAILAELRSLDFDPLLRIEDDEGQVLGQNDDVGPGDLTSRLGFVAPRAGQYRLIVTSPEPGRTGEYRLEVAGLQTDGEPEIIRGELTEQSAVAQGRRFQQHAVQAVAGRWHVIEATGRDFNPLLLLHDGAGKLLARGDAGGPRSARLAWPGGTGGPWQVLVLAESAGAARRYTLRVARYKGSLQAEPTERERQAQTAGELNDRALALYRGGKRDEATALLRQALTLRQQLFPQRRYPHGHRDLATSLNNLAAVLQDAGQYAEAGAYHEQALAMRRLLYAAPHYPQGHGELAMSLNNLGVLRQAAGQYEVARGYYDEALAMMQKLYPEAQYPRGHPDLAGGLSNLGVLLQEAGQYEAARAYFERALTMLRQLWPDQKNHLLARCLSNLGYLLKYLGEYETARTHLEQALVMRQKLYPEQLYPQGHPELVTSLNQLGILMEDVGQYDPARDYFDKALAMARRLYPERLYPAGHPLIAVNLSSLGMLRLHAGQLEPARAVMEQALAMQQKLYPQEQYPHGHPYLALSLNNLGTLLKYAGQYEAARGYYEQALAMRQALYPERHYPQGHPHLATSLHNLGALLHDVRQFEAARGYYEQALAMFQTLYPPSQYPQGHFELATALNNLGALLKDAGQVEAARRRFEQALTIFRQLYPQRQYPRGHPHLITSLNNLANLLRDARQFEAARGHLEQALAMVQQLYPERQNPDGHFLLAATLSNLGALAQAEGKDQQAYAYLRRAMAMSRVLSARHVALAPEAQALDLLRTLPHLRDGYLAVGLRAAAAPAELYANVWPSRGLVSRLLQRRHQATRVAQQGDVNVRQAWTELAVARAALAHLLATPTIDPARRGPELERLTGRKEELERALAKLLPELDRARELDRLGPADLAALLPAGHAFIDLLRYTSYYDQRGQPHDRYLAFITPAGGSVLLVELGDAAAIDRAVRAWRERIAQYRDTPADARQVAVLLWQPLARILPAQTKVIYLAPDGELARLPWAALPGTREGTVLLEELALAVVPHGPFLLEQLKYPPSHAVGRERILGLGDVAYGTAEAPAYAPLPGTAAELAKLQELAGPRDVVLLRQGEARWDKLQQGLAQSRYAHLATHGYYGEKALGLERQRLARQWQDWQPGQARSALGHGARSPLGFIGLALAGANRPQGEVPSIVTGEQLLELPLEELRLCVLSACESGLGDLGPLTGEAVQGLPHALHLAGCPNVISSLWNVNDQATAALMAKLYDGLWREGKTPLEALRQAQLLVYGHPELVAELAERGPTALKTLRLPPAAAPGRPAATKLWAGFVLSGSGR
jgi:tetratricopeptide (TPR) repeat protein